MPGFHVDGREHPILAADSQHIAVKGQLRHPDFTVDLEQRVVQRVAQHLDGFQDLFQGVAQRPVLANSSIEIYPGTQSGFRSM